MLSGICGLISPVCRVRVRWGASTPFTSFIVRHPHPPAIPGAEGTTGTQEADLQAVTGSDTPAARTPWDISALVLTLRVPQPPRQQEVAFRVPVQE